VIRTRTSVPKVCVDTAKLADEVISRLTATSVLTA
jgi:hypothetical protein